MRPLKDVIADARNRGERLSYCDCVTCEARRRELEEWEAKLVVNVYRENSPSWKEAESQLAEIRSLLGRTEPEHSHTERFPVGSVNSWTGISNVVGPDDLQCDHARDTKDHLDRLCAENEKLNAELARLKATARRLMEACEAADVALSNNVDAEAWLEAIRAVKLALAAARAELAGEATNAPVRHTDE